MIDEFSDPRLRDLLAVAARRPCPSPGWGKLIAVKGGVVSNGRERALVKAGITRVTPDHWIAKARPEMFRPCDKRDTSTRQFHARTLDHALSQLERGTTSAEKHRGRLYGMGVLPRHEPHLPDLPRKGPESWRLR